MVSCADNDYTCLVFLVWPALSREFAWDSEMMEAVTTGGDMCTFSLVPTNNLIVALNLVFVFNTCNSVDEPQI